MPRPHIHTNVITYLNITTFPLISKSSFLSFAQDPSPRVLNMSLNVFAIMAIVAGGAIAVAVIFVIIHHYLMCATENPEEKQRRLEFKNAEMELKRLKKEQKRKKAQEEEDEMPDSVYFGWTAAC
jgi:uncharacterized membrane protein (DUF106 family)